MPAFYNDGVERPPVLRERERWLLGVLIVTAIVGVSAAVRVWPAPADAPAPLLASRSLHLLHAAPIAQTPRSVVANIVKTTVAAPTRPAEHGSPVEPPPAVAAAAAASTEPRGGPPEITVTLAAVEPVAVAPLLVSRSLDVPVVAPAMTRDAQVASSESPTAIIELPAVAVTRVVTVAGRGIRTGLRATSAVFRAAF